MDRQEGYYWVKDTHGFILIAYWNSYNDGHWLLIGETTLYKDNDFNHINELRIKQPGDLPD